MSNGIVRITGLRWLVIVLLFQLGFLAGLNYQIGQMRELQRAMGRGVAGLLIDSASRELQCGKQEINPTMEDIQPWPKLRPELQLTPEEQDILREYTDRAKKRKVY